MAKHVCSLYELIRSNSEENQRRDWNDVENRIKMQLPLRAVSCVQLASKLTSHYKVCSPNELTQCFDPSTGEAYTQDVFSYFQAISPGKARRFLNSIGHRYTTNSILKSEIRVLKTLDYQTLVNSPLTFLETILEILGKQLKN